jgi:hypothetical protein
VLGGRDYWGQNDVCAREVEAPRQCVASVRPATGRAHGVAVLRSCLCSRGAHQVRWGRRGAANLAAQVAGRCVANTSPRPRDESVAADVRGRLPEMHVVTCVRAASGYGVPSARGGGRLDSMAGAGSARRSEQRACLGPRLAMLEINVTPRVG